MADAKDDESELSRIKEEIARLQSEIEQSSLCGRGLLRSHFELQHELEVVLHRHTELEENIRVQNVRRHAVESGFGRSFHRSIHFGRVSVVSRRDVRSQDILQL
jgi:hypothetical protein